MTSLDSLWATALRNVEEYGVSMMSVFGDESTPQFTYTLGLSKAGLPELIVFGLRPELAQHVLNDIASRLLKRTADENRQSPVMGEPLNDVLGGGMRVVLLEVTPEVSAQYLHWARRFANDGGYALNVWQLVWPDGSGRLPWEAGFDQKFSTIQPLIGRDKLN